MTIFLAIILSEAIEHNLSSLRSSFTTGAGTEFSPSATKICAQHRHIVPIHNLGKLNNRPLLAELDLALSHFRWNSFPLVLQNVFSEPPTPRKPYTEYFAAMQKSDRLEHLHKRLATLLRQTGLSPSPRRYRPHVLLALSDYASNEQTQLWVQRYNLFRSCPMQVDTVSLLERFGHYDEEPYRILASYHSIDAAPNIQESCLSGRQCKMM